ncbi:endonuclease VII domain-containing protein [Streptomyces griseofuscus]|uniref:Recombination endonuclease VII n=1 Tax=Streptomyces yunnanensis TaxID=156453 RepID=A0A9X8N7U7_9ACTN|nr:Recombination endonuclease VII [Streptomyces yunnanensis]
MADCKKGFKRCDKCQLCRALKFYTGARGRVCTTCQRKARSRASHASRVQATYGLKPGEYDELFRLQGGVCAICRQSRSKRLDVDHCHKTGVVRGLCCARCNRQLLAKGLRDNPEIARNAAEYLEDPPAVRLIGQRFFRQST